MYGPGMDDCCNHSITAIPVHFLSNQVIVRDVHVVMETRLQS